MPERERRRARDEQVDAIGKIRSGTVIFIGFSSAKEIISIVADEIPSGETAVRFVVLGLPPSEQESLAQHLSTLKPIEQRAFSIARGDIASFFATIDHLFAASPPRAHRIRVGKSEVDLHPTIRFIDFEKTAERSALLDICWLALVQDACPLQVYSKILKATLLSRFRGRDDAELLSNHSRWSL